MPDQKVESRYRSRTYWLCWGIMLLASGLVWFNRIEGAGWVTTAGLVVGAWQARRAWDNSLEVKRGD